MAIDRYRAAFAREAVHGLAEQDLCRIHSLTLDGKLIACLIVFVEAGVAYTWKTAYDENYSAFSPGTLLMIEVTKQHLDDPNIEQTDSCAVPDHPVMARLWSERKPIGTLVIGMTPAADRMTRQAASQLHLYRETRNFARLMRNRVRNLLKRAVTEPVRCRLALRAVAEDAADDLAGRRQRHGIDEFDLARIFMRRQALAHPLADLGGKLRTAAKRRPSAPHRP